MKTASGISQFLLTDQVGTLRAVADTSGAIVKRIDYDSFGNIIADSNPSFTVPFGFAGGLHDRDTGLVRFGYRDYSPELGRFVAKDPIDFAGGDTNLYAYVMNDPINLTDRYGLMWNSSSNIVYVKPENGEGAIPVLPGAKYDYPVDGVAVPYGNRGPYVFKVTDPFNQFFDVNDNGVWLPPPAFINELGGGGLLDSWPDDDWKPLFRKIGLVCK
jgi:RHS repeat-associated protein